MSASQVGGRSRCPRPEDELALLLAGTAQLRSDYGERIAELAARCAADQLALTFGSHGLLGLLGTRLESITPGGVLEALYERVREAVAHGRRRAVLFEHLTGGLLRDLERAGIRAMPLKGPWLAARLHGDAGLRQSNDVDLLVSVQGLNSAVKVLERRGYRLQGTGVAKRQRLPDLHHALAPPDAHSPAVELHWRVHWYEGHFSQAMLERSSEGLFRVAEARDELTALMLFYARDGFAGLRYPADLAAWWDRHRATLDTPPLDRLTREHSQLRAPLEASALTLERIAGVPLGRLISAPLPGSRRRGVAVRAANWSLSGDPEQVVTTQGLVDLLLSPPGRLVSSARRWLLVSDGGRMMVQELLVGSGDRGARIRRGTMPALHPLRRVGRLALGLWSVRHGRETTPLPRILTRG